MQNLKHILISLKNLFLKTGSYILVSTFLLLIAISSTVTIWNTVKDGGNSETFSTCNTAQIKINGQLVEYKSADENTWTDETVSSNVLVFLDNIENNPAIKAVIIEINSGGGSPIGGQNIANALKRMSKPTIALIERQGLSSSYWLSTGASKIYASNISDVGDIGIIQEQYQQVNKDKQDGYTYTILTSNKYKAIGSYHVALTEDDKKLLMRDIMKMHNIFVDEVARNRHLDRNVVAKLADGSTMMGVDALKAGLIDELGDMFAVKNYLAGQIGEEVNTCKY